MKNEDELEKRFNRVVDDVLKQIFGQDAALIIYNYLEKNNTLDEQEILEKIESFARGLESFLNCGAFVVEGIILKNLYLSYGIPFEQIEEGRSFVEYVGQLKTMITESEETKRER